MLYDHSDATTQSRHNPPARCGTAGKSDLLPGQRELEMKSWERAEGGEGRDKKVILVVVCLGPWQ